MQLRKICNHPYIFNNVDKIDEDIVKSSVTQAQCSSAIPLRHVNNAAVLSH